MEHISNNLYDYKQSNIQICMEHISKQQSHIWVGLKKNTLFGGKMMINSGIIFVWPFVRPRTRVGFMKDKHCSIAWGGHHIAGLFLFWAISDAGLILYHG